MSQVKLPSPHADVLPQKTGSVLSIPHKVAVEPNFRITEDDELRITEDGSFRILETN